MLVYVSHGKWVVYCFKIVADSIDRISEDCSDAAGIKPHDMKNGWRCVVSSVLFNYTLK